MKILVVDDEKTIVKGIKFNLENEGYQVDVCYDGETAVDMARRGEYAVILLDLMMPKLDGLGACQQIRQFSTVPMRPTLAPSVFPSTCFKRSVTEVLPLVPVTPIMVICSAGWP